MIDSQSPHTCTAPAAAAAIALTRLSKGVATHFDLRGKLDGVIDSLDRIARDFDCSTVHLATFVMYSQLSLLSMQDFEWRITIPASFLLAQKLHFEELTFASDVQLIWSEHDERSGFPPVSLEELMLGERLVFKMSPAHGIKERIDNFRGALLRSLAQEKQVANRVRVCQSKLNVLIVDDDKFALEVLGEILRASGENCTVFKAENWTEAIAIANTTRFDLVLLDLMLGGSSNGSSIQGTTAIERMRSQYHENGCELAIALRELGEARLDELHHGLVVEDVDTQHAGEALIVGLTGMEFDSTECDALCRSTNRGGCMDAMLAKPLTMSMARSALGMCW